MKGEKEGTFCLMMYLAHVYITWYKHESTCQGINLTFKKTNICTKHYDITNDRVYEYS